MKFFIYLLIICSYNFFSYAEKIPAGYVAKWDTTPLTEVDYTTKNHINCQ